MPLVDFNMLPTSPSAGYMMDEEQTEKLQVVVYSFHNRSVGLVVDRIIDIVEFTGSSENLTTPVF